MKGKLIAIEGLDGSGKATQTGLLYEALTKSGAAVRKISFPDYDSPSSALVKMYLSGAFGSDPSDVSAWAASSFYAVDRYAGYKTDWGRFYEDGGLILADRYTTSNAIHQCSKLPEAEWDAFLNWLFDYEYHLLGLPAPDLVIYLQVDVDTSQALLETRCEQDHTEKDIHEASPDYLRRSAAAAGYCARRQGWKTVLCMRDGRLRTAEDIHQEILTLL